MCNVWRMIHFNYKVIQLHQTVMILVFIISDWSGTPKFSNQVGCSPAGVDTTNIWLQQAFACWSNRQEVGLCALHLFIHSLDLCQWIQNASNQTSFCKDFPPRLMILNVSVPIERLVDFSVNVQPSASPCLPLPLTTELWWLCQGRSDLRNFNCTWTPATWTPSPPATAPRQSSAPPWWRSGRRPIL